MKVSVIAVCLCVLLRSVGHASEAEDREAFNERYAAWRAWVNANLVLSDLSASREFFAIGELGPSVIPFVVEQVETNPDEYDFALVGVISRLTGYRFSVGEWPDGEPGDEVFDNNRRRVLSYVRWWKKGRFKTGERFAERYAEWRRLLDEGKTGDAEKAFRKIGFLGTPVLPYLIERIEQEPEFVRAVARLTMRGDGGPTTNATPAECRLWWEKNKTKYELPPLEDGKEKPQPAADIPEPAEAPAAVPPSRARLAVPLAAGAGILAALFLFLARHKRRRGS
jgi:hypothetical protein